MPSERARQTTDFEAMNVLERANAMDDVVHLEVGEPDFDPPSAVVDRAVASLRAGDVRYTEARGTPALRRAIAAHYERTYGVTVAPERVVVTPGSSPALALTTLALVDPGDEVVLTDPHYACYPNFVTLADGRVRTVPLAREDGFRVDPAALAEALPGARALLLNSPANPTGAVLPGATLEAAVAAAADAGARVVSDEIYHGLSYDAETRSVLEYTDEAFVLDGVSKRYGMTGWRLGWVVVPPDFVDAVNRLAQNLLICAPSFVQDAAVEALRTPPSFLADVRETYRERRDYLVDAVADWPGVTAGYEPGGAYYLLVDASDVFADAFAAADAFLDAGVAVTPGPDFGAAAGDYVRLSYATDTESLAAADRRVRALLADRA
ncbi:MAG: aminotransferase class I/II-fold pyridoxal phosphate-dependent enzyme [Halobacteriaceae archaeon]